MENLKMSILKKVNSNPAEVLKVIENMNRHGKTFAIVSNSSYISSFRKTLKGAISHAEKSCHQWYDEYFQEMTQNVNEVIEIKIEELTDYQNDVMAWYEFLLNNPEVIISYSNTDYFYNVFVNNFNVSDEIREYLAVEVERVVKGFVINKPTQSTATETVKIDVVDVETVESKDEPQEAETTATESVKVVYNTDKNGIELYFDGKPSQLTLELLKANGWRWARYNKCWYIKDTEKSRQFVATFTATETEQKTLDNIDIEIDNPSKYTVSNELSKRENDGNWIFRTKEIDHNEELQKIFKSFLTCINDILPELDKTDQLKLKRNFNYFMKKYHENYIKQLTLKANNPSWAVTGRSGRNMDKYNREMDRLHKLTGESIKLYNIMLEKIEMAERKIKKVS